MTIPLMCIILLTVAISSALIAFVVDDTRKGR